MHLSVGRGQNNNLGSGRRIIRNHSAGSGQVAFGKPEEAGALCNLFAG